METISRRKINYNTDPVRVIPNYINGLNFLVMFPSSIAYNSKTHTFFLNKSTNHKKIVFVMHLIFLIYIAFNIFSSSYEQLLSVAPRDRLRFCNDVIWKGYLLVSMYVYWRKREKIIDFINNLHFLSTNLTEQGIPPFGNTWPYLFLRATLPLVVSIWALLDTVKLSDQKPTLDLFRVTIMDKPKLNYFGRVNFSNSVQGKYSAEDYLVAIVCLILDWFVCLIPMCGYMLLFTTSFTTWLIIVRFTRHLHTMEYSIANLKLVLDTLSQIRDVLNSCENCVGILFGACCLGLIPTYIIDLPLSLSTEDWTYQSVIYTYFLIFVGTIIAAAEVHSGVKLISSWLQSYLNSEYSKSTIQSNSSYFLERPDSTASNLNTLIMVSVQQINGNNIGVRGKMFTITYGLLGSVSSLIMTYVIIIYQFKGTM